MLSSKNCGISLSLLMITPNPFIIKKLKFNKMNKSFFFLLFISVLLFNCTKNEVTTSELSLEEPIINQLPTSDSEVISSFGPQPCKYRTLKIEDYGADGSAYYNAIENQLKKYASCLANSGNEDCTIGYANGNTISFILPLCHINNFGLCTDKNGVVGAYTYINPESFNVEQYIQSKLNESDECGQGCIAVANRLSVIPKFKGCPCGAETGSPWSSLHMPCKDIALEAHKSVDLEITVSYYCCCLTDGGGTS